MKLADLALPGGGAPRTVFNVQGPCTALFTAAMAGTFPDGASGGSVILIAGTAAEARVLIPELKGLLPPERVLEYPDYETLPYDIFSPQQDLISSRLESLFCLASGYPCVVVTTAAAMLHRVAPPDFVLKNALILKKGQVMGMEKLAALLTGAGYTRVSQVYGPGEFAVRGSLIDLFPSGMDSPFRLDFFDEEIESIRLFDAETQRTTSQTDSIRLLPAREFPIQKGDIERFRRSYREEFGASLSPDSVYQQVSSGHLPGGIEYYLPLFLEETVPVTAYLPPDTRVILAPGAADQMTGYQDYVRRRHQGTDGAGSSKEELALRPRLPPERICVQADEMLRLLKERQRITLRQDPGGAKDASFDAAPLPDISLGKGGSLERLRQFLDGCPAGMRFLFSLYSRGRLDTIRDLLRPEGITLTETKDLPSFLSSDDVFAAAVTPFDQGMIFPSHGICVISETELFGTSFVNARRNSRNVQADAVIRNLGELKQGDLIVHYKYGIGRYQGLEIRDINGVSKEFFCLEYAGGDRLYVEITELHLISRYTGGANPPLNTLGSDTWEKNRKKAREKASDAAAQLLDIYSRRALKKGHAFSFDQQAYSRFAAGFPYDETEDQQKAIQAVIADLTSERTMDRLICGDVGFGKTEVALRAAFIAVSDGRQVAVLVPTVLLADQHYETFRTRFADEAVNIEVLSRFRTAAEQQKALEDLKEGRTDIIIGTHKLLSKSVKYKNLGLLIIDEEHRFGVRQKEAIKSMRSEVDILTLTATPIPRTLNMAFSGLRDLSLITTPPARRLSIKTFLKQSDSALIREAVLRELKRGGQVYYLYNDTLTIEKRAEDLANLIPEASIQVAHGQMREKTLAAIMNSFYRRKFSVLVCTTIIETGIDIPTANTIIIERADRFGLAQLHQIRGRVGRSARQAYAYLLTPPPDLMTRDAVKRLEAIASHDDLGAGFALANHDLEIRGAGELLGDDQSGQIAAVGFGLYMEMLENAVRALRSGKEPSLTDVSARGAEINLGVSAVIPDDYMPDVSIRLSFYKRLASAEDEKSLKEIRDDMTDRYGALPPPASGLFEVNRIRIQATDLGIQAITVSKVTSFVRFGPEPKADPGKIVELLTRYPESFRMEGTDRIRILRKVEPEECLKFVQDILSALSG